MTDTWGLRQGDAITPELTAMRLLGGGSSYEAFLAFDEITYGPVVAKVLRPDRVASESSRVAMRRETEALTSLRHPVLVRALREDLDGERPYVVMEHVEGPRLSTLIRRHGRLPEQQYLPLALDLASVLHYLGRAGWVHLDIKPSNLIMGSPARLIDLSVARPTEAAAALRHEIGTDAYMAPEQCLPGERGEVGPASDVWGLGATLFHAVSGERPFDRGDPSSADRSERYPQLVERPYPLPPRTPPEVVKVIEACLAPDPGDRPEPAEVSEMVAPALERLPRASLGGLRIH
ncbi:serine/threonine protein kinase [Nocardioides albertanoniae]|uniref:non-specific serine/threonine protein kinase n=1 Tax=Nocardioides albertanoniae TaxID=1175486 RepID=A0A543A5I2_9ACTN|nr:serine/threonine-protein kinase [Nocardioides albertanoniae]TQL67859.1 serine/threonine protein kinase [Nocardioides albertanoniae]